MTRTSEIMQQSLELISANKWKEAVSVIDAGINHFLEEGVTVPVVILSKHAGVTCDEMGDLDKAKRYYELALKYDSDPYLYFALGDLYLKLDELDLASQHFDSCYTLAAKVNDSDLIQMVEKKRGAIDVS